jgi:hypothetical protein
MNNTNDYQLTTNYMWFKMILKIFENQTSKNDPFSYFISQFKIRKDNFNDTYFYKQCQEHTTALKQAFEVLLANKRQLPSITTDIIEQVYKCEFVFGYDKDVELGIFEERILLIEVKDFDNILKALDELNKLSKGKSLTKPIKENLSLQVKSFTYKKLNRGLSNLTDLMNSLKDKELIAIDTKLADFRNIFSGISIDTQVVWTGNTSELSYFVKQLHNDLKLVENLSQKQWIVTIHCFIDVNQKLFQRDQLKQAKPPATSGKIDLALKTLN